MLIGSQIYRPIPKLHASCLHFVSYEERGGTKASTVNCPGVEFVLHFYLAGGGGGGGV